VSENCVTCQVCFACQGQEQVTGLGCGNCYSCQVGYAVGQGMQGPGAGPMGQGPGFAGPPGACNRQPRPVFDWELREISGKLDALLALLGKLAETLAPESAAPDNVAEQQAQS